MADEKVKINPDLDDPNWLADSREQREEAAKKTKK